MITTQSTWPEQSPRFIIKRGTTWNRQDLLGVPNTTTRGQGHARGTENVSIPQLWPDSTHCARNRSIEIDVVLLPSYRTGIILFWLKLCQFWVLGFSSPLYFHSSILSCIYVPPKSSSCAFPGDRKYRRSRSRSKEVIDRKIYFLWLKAHLLGF